MADNDYKELIEFLGRQFEGIYDRLDNTATKDDLANFATKDDLAAAKEEVMRHTGVLIEAVQHKLDLLAEGSMATHERIERDKEENEREHGRLDKMTLVNTADISRLDQRVGRLEGKA